jgi:hypothetical protein
MISKKNIFVEFVGIRKEQVKEKNRIVYSFGVFFQT